MRNKVFAAFIMCLMFVATFSCKKDEDPNQAAFKINKESERIEVGTTEAVISGTYEYPGKVDRINVRVGTSDQLFGSDVHQADMNGKAYSVHLTNLLPGTLYYYRYEVDYGSNDEFLTDIYSFTTLSEAPTVKTLEALALDSTTFRIKCEVLSGGGQEVTERGICWNSYGDPTMDDETMQHTSAGLGQYTIRMENLALGKKYFVRAYAKSEKGVGFGEEIDFETLSIPGMPVNIVLSCNPTEGGSVIGEGVYSVGSQCTVMATANPNYTFVNWTENGVQVSSDAAYTFTVTVGRSLVANFTNQDYVITAQSDPEEGGTVTGAGGYNYGDECVLNATTKVGYNFVNWTKNGSVVSTEAQYSFTVTERATYVAHFQANSYTISVLALPVGSGTVTGGGTFNYDASCTVVASAAEGYIFTEWTDDGDPVSTDANYTFIVKGNRNLVAHFVEHQVNEYSINVSANPSEGGTVTGGGPYEEGTECTVVAEPKAGFSFVNWTEGGSQVSTDAEYHFTVGSSRNLVANFTAQAYVITTQVNPEDGGTAIGAGGYSYGDECALMATARSGYEFVKWTKNGVQVSTNTSYTFTVTESATYIAHFQTQSYTITATADPAEGGSISGGGNYTYGQSCTLIATPAPGYAFVNWTTNGAQITTNPSMQFTVTGSATYVAHFLAQGSNDYIIAVSANPSNGGTVSGGGAYALNQSCTVTATPAAGYTFQRWMENGNQASTSANYTFIVTGNRTLVAQFQASSYTITASASPTNGGSVSGGGTYNYGQSCTLVATPASGYTFIKWTKNGIHASSNATYTFDVTESASYVAHFQSQAPTNYTISVSASPSNGGSVSGGGTYQQGQSCTVSATASTGYTFTNWTENGSVVSTNASYTFTVNSNRTLVAHFTAQSYTITASASPTNGGSVSGGGSYTYGQSCTLVATPASGYTFVNWTKNGTQVSTSATYTFTVTGSGTYVAHFQVQAPTTYTVSVSASPSNGGSVSGGGTYQQGQSCTVSATASTGYTFTNWTENGSVVSTNASYTFTVNSNRTLVAHFSTQSYTITAMADPTNGGSVSGGGSYTYGQSCTLVATPASGYTFVNWTKNGTQVSTNATYTFTVTESATYVAHFTAQSYTITATADPTNGGSVSGGGSYTYGQSCTLVATPASGYTFVNWTKNGTQVSTNATYTFTVTGSGTYVAHFQMQSYTISVSASPSNGGSVSGGGTFNYGQNCTVVATAASGYNFVNWTENGTTVSTNSSYTFTVSSSRTLVAHFEAPTYAIGDLYPDAINPVGVVFYVYSNGTHGKIVSLQAAVYPNKMYWDSRQIMYETGGTSATNGVNNFNLMSYSYHPPKTWIVDNLGSGWYLPAYQELITLSNNIQAVNSTRTANGYEELCSFFWSSTEYSAMPSCAYMVALTNDYYMGYSNGWYGYVTKNANQHAVVGIKQF